MRTTVRIPVFAICFSFALAVSGVVADEPVRPGFIPSSKTTTENTNAASAPISLKLKPTAIAPSGAGGAAEIRANSIALHLSQLSPGKYELEAVRRSDGTFLKLGVLTIVDATLSPSRQATDNKKEASAHPESVSVETDATVKLPEDLAPSDISRVLLLVGGNAVLDSKAQ
jgi:hypothetical protein